MGTGQYLDEPISTNGTSWYWQGYSGSNLWATNNYRPCSTGSYTGSSPLNSVNSYAGGGTWWTGSIQSWFNTDTYPISSSQTFNYKYDNDANFNVTNIIRAQYTGAISSDGFIVKQSPEFVQNIN